MDKIKIKTRLERFVNFPAVFPFKLKIVVKYILEKVYCVKVTDRRYKWKLLFEEDKKSTNTLKQRKRVNYSENLKFFQVKIKILELIFANIVSWYLL